MRAAEFETRRVMPLGRSLAAIRATFRATFMMARWDMRAFFMRAYFCNDVSATICILILY